MKRKIVLPSLRIMLAFFATLLLLGIAAPSAFAAGKAAPVAAPPAQSSSVAAVAKGDVVNIRSGPSTNYPVVGTMAFGQTCPVIGRDTSTGWWLVQCPGVTGWVSPDLVSIVGDPSTVPLYSVGGPAIVAPPEPGVPPPPTTFVNWKASYYANKDLAGVPVMVVDVPEVNFDWGYGSPGPLVPSDYFSARYERTLNLPSGSYLLTLRVDDGARVFVDDQLVMDDWRVGSVRELSTIRTLSGNHRFRVEYFEDTGMASVFFGIAPTATAPPPTPDLPVPQDQWRAQYFNNTDLAGSPTVVQYQPRGVYPLDMNWGGGSPAPGVGSDYWSARFEGSFYFGAGDYDFFAQADDGVRVWLDNLLVIDAWYDGYKERSNRFNQIGTGYHTVRVEYYERVGGAAVRVWWQFANGQPTYPGYVPPPTLY